MAEPTPVVPTLFNMTTPNLTKPADVAVHLVRWLFTNPGYTSTINENEMISYRKLVAMYGTDADVLAEHITDMLNQTMLRYFPDGGYIASCTVEDKVGYSDDEHVYQGDKAIKISFTDANGAAIIPRGAINVNHDGSTFEIKFSAR